jgi:hypothetical protein
MSRHQLSQSWQQRGSTHFNQAMIQYLEMDTTLFLAIPSQAYEILFQAPVIQQLIRNLGMLIMIFDPESESVVTWIR